MRQTQPLFALLLFVAGVLPSAVAVAEGSVARAIFTTEIKAREPVGDRTELTNDNSKVYFFTELRGLKGRSITHRWEYAGQPHAAITFKVGSHRWRVWSSKNLHPNWTGVWTVTVLDEVGNTLAEKRLNYIKAEAPDATSEAGVVEEASTE